MTSRLRRKLWSPRAGINLFFILARVRWGGLLAGLLVLGGVTGCQSTATAEKKDAANKPENEKKEVSTLRLHLEENDVGLGVGKVEVFRADPMKLIVQKTAFVDEGDIAKARVIESPYGGVLIQIEYIQRGRMALQMATAAHPGRRVAVWARWTSGRWLAAPVVQRGIEDGLFTFTPDCTREEAERIVRGLNNVAIKLKNQAKPPSKSAAKKNAKKAKSNEAEEMFK